MTSRTRPPGLAPRAILAALAATVLGIGALGAFAGADEAAEPPPPLQASLECLPGELVGTLISEYPDPEHMGSIPGTPEDALEGTVADLPGLSPGDFERVADADGAVRFAVEQGSRRTVAAEVTPWGDGWVVTGLVRCHGAVTR